MCFSCEGPLYWKALHPCRGIRDIRISIVHDRQVVRDLYTITPMTLLENEKPRQRFGLPGAVLGKGAAVLIALISSRSKVLRIRIGMSKDGTKTASASPSPEWKRKSH